MFKEGGSRWNTFERRCLYLTASIASLFHHFPGRQAQVEQASSQLAALQAAQAMARQLAEAQLREARDTVSTREKDRLFGLLNQ